MANLMPWMANLLSAAAGNWGQKKMTPNGVLI
jgi:hypothetical protein